MCLAVLFLIIDVYRVDPHMQDPLSKSSRDTPMHESKPATLKSEGEDYEPLLIRPAEKGTPITRYSSLNGLSQSTVYDFFQDRFGYLWIATAAGLNRFDGREFEVFFNHQPGMNNIKEICNSLDGHLLLSTKGGLVRFNRISLEFEDPQFQKEFILNKRVRGLVTVPGKYSAFLYENELLVFGEEGQLLLSEPDMNAFTTTQGGDIWACQQREDSQCLVRYVWNEGVWETIDSFSEKTPFFQLIMDPGKLIWCISRSNISQYDLRKKRFKPFFASQFGVITDAILGTSREDPRGESSSLWLATESEGCFHLVSEQHLAWQYLCDPRDEESISQSHLISLFQDREHNIWMGSAINGMCMLSSEPRQFEHIYSKPWGKQSLSHNLIRCFFEDSRERLWVGTDGGGLNLEFNQNRGFEQFSCLNHLKRIYAIRECEPDTFMLACFFDGLYLFYPTENRAQQLMQGSFLSIAKDAEKNFWTYTKHTLLKWNEKGTLIDHLDLDETVLAIDIDTRGRLWLTTNNNGLLCVDPVSKNKKTFQMRASPNHLINEHDVTADSYLSANKLWCVNAAESGLIYVGTDGSGLDILNPETGEIRNIGAQFGFYSVNGVLIDGQGCLWVSSNNGLFLMAKDLQSAKHFNQDFGLQANEFKPFSYLKRSNGDLYFGGVNGYNSFNPASVIGGENPHRPLLKSISSLEYQLKLKAPCEETTEFTFPYFARSIQLKFALLDFSLAQSHEYAYKLSGSNEKWVNLKHQNSIDFLQLEPGLHKLQVKVANAKQIWSQPTEEISILITPPVWWTWWMKVLYFLIGVSILVLIHRVRLNFLLHIEKMRTKISRDLHDEVGAILTNIRLNSELILHQYQKSEKVLPKAQKISKQAREAIQVFSDIIWALDMRKDSSSQLILRIKEAVNFLFAPLEIEWQLHLQGLEQDVKLNPEFRQNVYLIFKESFNNIAKHSGATQVSIRIEASEHVWSCSIHDNGKGFDIEKEATGQGLQNLKLRAKRLHCNLEISNQSGILITFKPKK